MNPLPMTDRRGRPPAPGRDRARAEAAVTALYAEHALELTRIAHAMLGDLAAAEDAVQDAFSGLFRRWAFLADPAKAPEYLRSSVLNGCRSALRTAGRRVQGGTGPAADDADATACRHLFADAADIAVLRAEDRRAVLAALRRLPVRQREALVLRYYLDMPDDEIARILGVQRVTVRSAVHRGLASLERILRGELP